MSLTTRTLCAISTLLTGSSSVVLAQTQQLPPIVITSDRNKPATGQPAQSDANAPRNAVSDNTNSNASLTAPTVEQARKEINNTPGAVAIVPAEAFKDQRTSTVKDMLDFVPGVWAQPKWAEDTRLSIRGSGLSRGFHGRSLQLYMDGIPINQADGYFDFQEIDPSAYRYVEVYRGANALRFGANSLGGAINFVTPSGRDANLIAASVDAGSFGYRRAQSSSGAAFGAFDYFVTGSYQTQEGFRDHSDGNSMRGSGNFGYKLTPNIETRFYFNGNSIEQHIPGSVTKSSALTSPTTAAAANLRQDYQRNVNSTRIANKTAIELGPTLIELGVFGVERHLMHPIFQWLDYNYDEYGAFGRATDERFIGAFRNRIVAGVNLHNGTTGNQQFANGPGAVKGALLSSSIDTSKNLSAYVENSFYFLPAVALVTGTQFLNASRERADRFLSNGNQSGRNDFSIWSPKFGLLWDLDPTAQVFTNISRSAEVPSFGENTYVDATRFNIEAQTATTYEIGTRGRRPDYTWDFAIYRANINNELQCLFNPATLGSCNVINADKTIHQGVEAGFGAALLKSMFVRGDAPDRLWLNVAYTYSDFRFDNDPLYGNNFIPGAPPHYLRGELLYKHPSGFSFGPNIEWVPEGYYVDNRNSLTTEPYTLWGLRAAYDDGKNFSAYVEGRNLSDHKYISSVTVAEIANASSALFEPGTGRAYYAGAKFKW